MTGIGAKSAVVMHAWPVGGGIVAISPLPGAGGDYRGDLDHLASWRPAMVLSLVTPGELVDAGAMNLGQNIQDKGTRWVHLAVGPGGLPSASQMEAWPTVSEQARRALLGGGRVLVNSRNGGGRCGMAVLRLMIEAGEAPDEAEERLKSVCPEAEGTAEQMDWARAAPRGAARFVRHPDR
ncbi:protein-tyrosine phosphatase family protein [Sagittula stellata]|uniref:Protein phosphatase n=1 Tax=Sagittula stellata (strain ATCC 700073 / DSM 11524 / E-37) TaxID=388399 RepID=A3K5T8_SAGS3|nr:hypothetical protein [Sagittula stellata]EBA07477.1 hypothetical protein SSE37_21800 [Sagittula stellata E-37]